jgi:hypothetical protein
MEASMVDLREWPDQPVERCMIGATGAEVSGTSQLRRAVTDRVFEEDVPAEASWRRRKKASVMTLLMAVEWDIARGLGRKRERKERDRSAGDEETRRVRGRSEREREESDGCWGRESGGRPSKLWLWGAEWC